MANDILKTVICTTPPQVTYAQGMIPTHTATWAIETKQVVPADQVVLLAQGYDPSDLPPDAQPLPKYGSRLFWAEDEPKPDTGQTVGDFANQYPLGYADGGAFALDFSASSSNDRHNWDVSVTWRPPTPGGNQSQLRIDVFRDPVTGRTRVATEDGPDSATALAAREYWLEYRTDISSEEGAYRVTGGDTIAGAKFPMVNPAGEKYPPVGVDRTYVVQVISRLVTNTKVALDDLAAFENTTNNADLGLGGFIAPKHTVYFESSRTGRQKEFAEKTYYDLETRLVLYKEPRFIQRPAVGHWFLNAGKKEVVRDFDGNTLVELPLKSDGTVAQVLPAEQAIDVFSLAKPVDYSGFSFTV